VTVAGGETLTLLDELGYSSAEVEQLRNTGVID
jgi:hypothetical protein